MENRKEKKWDFGKVIQEGVLQITQEVKEIVKDIKTSASSALEKKNLIKINSASTRPYYEETKFTSTPEMKCELCHLDFTEELIDKYLKGENIICERCGQPFGEKPEAEQNFS